MAQGNFLQSLFNRGQDTYNLPPMQMPAPQLQDIMINQQGQQMSPEQIQSFYAQPQAQPKQGMGANIANALFGKQAPVGATPPDNAPLAELRNILINNPQSLDYTPQSLAKINEIGGQKVAEGMLQGLNFGIPEIAQNIEQYNKGVGVSSPIKIPKTDEEINAAKQNYLNSYSLGAAQNPRTGGLLNDIASGFSENASTPFAVSNLEPQQNKGFATRLGEGLGSAARFADSPLGRMALTAGVVGATGGSGLQALTFGATAGVGNQNLRTQDQFYRNQLQSEGVDTSNIQGYVTPEMYKNQSLGKYRVESLRLRNQIAQQTDNTKRAKMILDGFTNNIFSEAEAIEEAKKYGMTIDDLKASNQTRNADVNQYLAPAKKYAYETAPQIAMGNYELNRLKADPIYQAEVAGAVERAKKQASNYSEDVETYNTYMSKMPELKRQVANLNELAKTASYTKLGVAGDTLTRELGLPVGKGAVARTEYTAVINNQILPLLRETFGAQFTEREGESLRQSLGDVNKSPAEKQAVLNSFIRQKEMNIKSQARKINQYSGSNIQPFTPNANLTPIPRGALGGGAVRPRQTSKPTAKQNYTQVGKYKVRVK